MIPRADTAARFLVATMDHFAGDFKRARQTGLRVVGVEVDFLQPGKFMRIRTFYYLPPKAGFNWRGPARR